MAAEPNEKRRTVKLLARMGPVVSDHDSTGNHEHQRSASGRFIFPSTASCAWCFRHIWMMAAGHVVDMGNRDVTIASVNWLKQLLGDGGLVAWRRDQNGVGKSWSAVGPSSGTSLMTLTAWGRCCTYSHRTSASSSSTGSVGHVVTRTRPCWWQTSAGLVTQSTPHRTGPLVMSRRRHSSVKLRSGLSRLSQPVWTAQPDEKRRRMTPLERKSPSGFRFTIRQGATTRSDRGTLRFPAADQAVFGLHDFSDPLEAAFLKHAL